LIGSITNNVFSPAPLYTKDVNMYGIRAILITPPEEEG
jgi:hypothetical protein